MVHNIIAKENDYLEHLVVVTKARVPLVVEIVVGIAPALAPLMRLALWAVLEGVVPVACTINSR